MKQAAFMEKEAKYMRKIKKLEKKMKLRYIHELKKLCGEQVKEENNSKAIMSKRPRSTFTGENLPKRRKMVPKRPVRTQVVINKVTERLKEFIVNEIKGTELTLVIQKNMFKSDTDKGLNRLNMPIKQLESDEFLREDERRILSKTNPKENEIEVMVLGPTLEMYEKPMKLKMWHMKSSVNYVLTTSWHSFWRENKKDLDKDSTIQVWSFRRDEKLCFAVVCVAR
ncbi:hypothetical protein QVD17_20915 [Tagetes erecta]|uniref:B3 domain-containing protein n=1 Tax=Tagetes erecta TaxID=13708 RepID=A0AAD8KMK5_TARER|nr:hypothetical protein QVD17_20910 [Tagetes erecta]KAK1425557.1 hypothetical protein QVD17_20911 [Tagetes erecta]KAK1425558.1 hypothetical protein QVD17_20912 [Tagetes erecta]KAK1425559.1 hypothetical protein QVD17_20913 [Tagetes erecta]KAK1425560.1 hypothetical protein QVD17_20914 [Tagetes erecta]